jgi:uncharacterized membrane protein HdeD (DUF308 family)
MRKASGALSVIAALVLLFQASPESHMPLAMLGGVFVSVGVWLLRRSPEIPPDP